MILVPEAPVEALTCPAEVEAAAVPEAVAKTASVEPEAAAQEPTLVEAVPEAFPEAAAPESGPLEGIVIISEVTVSDVTVEVVAVESNRSTSVRG